MVGDGGHNGSVTDEETVDRPVRWTRSELAWGRANPDVHGLGAELDKLTDPGTDEGGDAEQTYIITATEDKIAEAVTRVNDWLADRPQSSATAAAHGFQRALSIPPRGPEGGEHDSFGDEDDDADED